MAASSSLWMPSLLPVAMVTVVLMSIATRQWVNVLWSRDKMSECVGDGKYLFIRDDWQTDWENIKVTYTDGCHQLTEEEVK